MEENRLMNAIQLLSKRILEAARRRPASATPIRRTRGRRASVAGQRLANAG